MIRWSERLFVLTSFGIIVCSEMNRDSIEFPTLFTYTMMSNIVSNKAHAKLSNFESTLRSAFSLACAFKSSIFQMLTICLLQFVVIFAASMHRPGFFHMDSPHDHLLIGQLYYLNFFALFMGYELTMIAGSQIYKANYGKK